MRLQNQVALITGASRGIGRAIALAYAREGARLVINARGAEALEAVRREIASLGAEVLALPADATRAADIERLVAAALDRFGRIDVLVNNAGVLGPSPRPNLLDFTEDQFNEVLRANLTGPFLLTQAVLPHMLDRGRGSVINVTSDASEGYAGWGAYGVSKAALEVLTRTWAQEVEEHGVRLNSVNPGDIQTQMHQDAYPGEDISDRSLPEQVPPVFVWLASDDSAAVTGERFDALDWTPPA